MDAQTPEEAPVRCGYAAVVGRPNVGKSTLLNHILGQQIAIVTPKPQTTRNRILAVHNTPDAQVVFLDTPGLHRPRGSLGRYMDEAARGAISEGDVCVWLIDTRDVNRKEGLTPAERAIGEQLTENGRPVVVLLNKIDIVRDKQLLLPLMEQAAAVEGVEEVIPISAKTGEGVAGFLDELVKRLPEGPRLYPEDMLSEQAERFFVSEIIREAVTDLTRQEIPYASAVVIDQFVEETKRCSIHATIHVERSSQRKIVIGRKGAMIKEIGTRAREASVRFLGCPVDLRLHVDVSPGWTRSPRTLRKMGYE